MKSNRALAGPAMSREDRIEYWWRQWLLTQLEPFIGQETVRMNDIINRIHGRPWVQRPKKDAA